MIQFELPSNVHPMIYLFIYYNVKRVTLEIIKVASYQALPCVLSVVNSCLPESYEQTKEIAAIM